MGSWMIIAPLAIAVLGFIAFGAGLVHAVKLHPGKASIRLGGGGIVAIVGLTAGLIGLNLQGYARLTYEVPLAHVAVKAVDPANKTFDVTVTRLDETRYVQTCRLQGDAWEIGGRFQKWKAWANEIGLNATYTLDQITNRYNTAVDGNGQRITACDLKAPQPKATQFLPAFVEKWVLKNMIVEDRLFGSASFMPMVDGAEYNVIATQFGFNAEPTNEVARNVNQQRAF
jgi:hypothetical protein